MLIMANYEWFLEFKGPFQVGDNATRKEGYDAHKQEWGDRCLKVFLRYFPMVTLINFFVL